MTDLKHEHDASRAARRRAYQAPAIEDTAEFETLALTCPKFPFQEECLIDGGYTNS